MFDRATVLAIALEELAICEGDDMVECDRLHGNDTIGPCPACPVKLDAVPGAQDGES
jgi:hypothetical protein